MAINPLPAFPRSARHIAVLSLFLELVEELDDLHPQHRAPSEAKLLAALPLITAARLAESLATAREEMSQLAPAVMAGP
jgi:hypothetical protein